MWYKCNMAKKDSDKPKIKQLIAYISRRKKPWRVAVYDKKTKKRAVGKTLPEVLKKIDKPTDDLIIIDKKEYEMQVTSASPDEEDTL